MNTIRSRSTFSFIVCSLVCACIAFSRPATTVSTACRNKFRELPCQVQDPSVRHVWKYKELPGDRWQELGVFSNKKASLSPNIPRKFKSVTNVFVNGSLAISSFAQELSGIYACQSYEGHMQRSVVSIMAVSCEKSVCEDDVAIIECDLLKYRNVLLFQPSEVVWKKRGTTLVEFASNMSVTYRNPKHPNIQGGLQGSLRIEYASKDVNGQRYTCVVRGEHGATRRQYSVVINVKECKNKSRACQGQSIGMECPYNLLLNTNTEKTRLEWYNDSTKIATLVKNKDHSSSVHSESSLFKINETNGMLTIRSIGVFDGGTYRCKIFRGTLLLAEHNVTLNVTQPCDKTEAEGVTKAKANKIRNTVHLVWFALFMVLMLPICLY